MKTLKTPHFLIFILAVLASVLSGCIKNELDTTASEASSIEQLVKDELSMDAAVDDTWDAMNLILDNGGYKSVNALPCNTTDSVTLVGDTLFHNITFSGNNCNGTYMRTGKMVIKQANGQKWSEPGNKVVMILNNYNMTRLSTGESVILNGKIIYENTLGGRLSELGNGVGKVIQKGIGSIAITFSNNQTQKWEMSRQRVFTGAMGNMIINATGIGAYGGINYLVYWGNGRAGTPFLGQINDAVIYKEACTGYACSGTMMLQLSGTRNNMITYGFNDNNQPVASSECPTKVKFEIQTTTYTSTLFIKL